MNQNLKYLIYGIILLGGGFYLGRMVGISQTYMETASALAFSHFNGASTNLNSHITLLQLMEAGDYKKVSEKLEALVDVDLIALSEYKPLTPLKNDILKSIERAKGHREKYPSTSKSPETVKKAFDLVK